MASKLRAFGVALLPLAACRSPVPSQPLGADASSSSVPSGSLAPAQSAPDAPELVVGQGIGPLRLGMTRAEAASVGLGIHPDPSGQFGDNVQWVGPYRVVFDGGDRVSSVELDLTASSKGVRVGSEWVAASATATDVARAIPGCGKLQGMQGGAVIECAKGTSIKVAGGNSGHLALHVQMQSP